MGGSLGKSESESESQSGFNQDVWGPQGDALQSLYGDLGNLFNQTNTDMQAQIPGSVDYMNQIRDQSNPYWQDQMQGGAYADMGLQDQLMSSLNQSMNQPSAMTEINAMIMGGEGNNYADAMRDQFTQDATNAQNNMLMNLDARAAASGMSGGSRHGTATAQGMEDINRNLQSNLAQTGFGTFDKDLDRKLAIAGQADQANLARQNMLSGMIGQQNAAQQSGLNYGTQMQDLNMGSFAPYMMPWQTAGAYSGAIGSPTVLGSGDMTGSSDAKGFSASGGIGGGK